MKPQPPLTDTRELLEALARLEQQRRVLVGDIAALHRKLGYNELTPLKAAAGEVGYHPETVRLWVNNRRVPGERRGGRWFVNLPSLQAYCSKLKAG